MLQLSQVPSPQRLLVTYSQIGNERGRTEEPMLLVVSALVFPTAVSVQSATRNRCDNIAALAEWKKVNRNMTGMNIDTMAGAKPRGMGTQPAVECAAAVGAHQICLFPAHLAALQHLLCWLHCVVGASALYVVAISICSARHWQSTIPVPHRIYHARRISWNGFGPMHGSESSSELLIKQLRIWHQKTGCNWR